MWAKYWWRPLRFWHRYTHTHTHTRLYGQNTMVRETFFNQSTKIISNDVIRLFSSCKPFFFVGAMWVCVCVCVFSLDTYQQNKNFCSRVRRGLVRLKAVNITCKHENRAVNQFVALAHRHTRGRSAKKCQTHWRTDKTHNQTKVLWIVCTVNCPRRSNEIRWFSIPSAQSRLLWVGQFFQTVTHLQWTEATANSTLIPNFTYA